MSRTQSAGLFRIVSDRHSFAITDAVYCKIATMDVYSTMAPSNRRIVEYTVVQWDTDPTTDSFATPPTPLETQSGFGTFVAIIPYGDFDVTELEMYCIKHLLSVVSTLEPSRFLKRGEAYVRSDTSFGMGYALFALNEEAPVLTVKSIYHLERFGMTDFTLLPTTAVGVALPLDSAQSLLTYPVVFDVDNVWFEHFKARLVSPRTYQFSNLVKVS